VIEYHISDRSGTQNLGFGFWKCHAGEMCLRQVEKDFFVKFRVYLVIFQIEPAEVAVWNFENHQLCQKFGVGGMKKILV